MALPKDKLNPDYIKYFKKNVTQIKLSLFLMRICFSFSLKH